MEKWSAAIAAGQPYEGEMRLRRADGEYRRFLIRTVPLRDEQRNIVKWYGASTDIEDGKRAEERSRQAAEELQALSRRLVELQESERQQYSERPCSKSPLDCLSKREIQVLKLVAEGCTSKEIARPLGVLPTTVDTYRSRIMAKLQASDVPALVRLAIRYRLIHL